MDGASGSTEPRRARFGIVAAALVLTGALLGALAFTVLPWLRQDMDSGHFDAASSQSTFGLVHAEIQRWQYATRAVSGHAGFGVAPAYFSWLAVTLLCVAVVAALLGAAPLGAATDALRPLAALVALVGFGLTFWAIDLFHYDIRLARFLGIRSASYVDYLSHGYLGFWAALAAFLLVGIGALLGPRRVAPNPPVAAETVTA